MSLRRRALGLMTAAAVAAAIAGCGEVTNTLHPPAGTANNLSVELDYFPNADHVGIYEAEALGYFKQADLNVHLHAPTNAATPLQLLESGKVDVAISYEPDVLLARNQNIPLVSVAAIVQRPLTSIVSVGSQNITTPKDLRGKTIGTSGIPYQSAFLQTILHHAHVPASSVKEVDVGEGLVPAMVSGRVNATLGAYWNYEAIQLSAAAQGPERDPHGPGGRAHLRRARLRRPQGDDRQPRAADPPLRPGGRQGLQGGARKPSSGDQEPRTDEPGTQVQACSWRASW